MLYSYSNDIVKPVFLSSLVSAAHYHDSLLFTFYIVLHTWRSGVRSAMHAASQLPERGPTDVDVAPAR